MTDRQDFTTYVVKRSLQNEINDLAWALVEAHKMGVDVEPYVELIKEAGLGQRIGGGLGGAIGWMGDKTVGAAGRAVGGIGRGIGRAANAAVSGLGGGVMRGAQRAGRAAMHGQGANNASYQLQDAIGMIDAALKAAPNLGQEGQAMAQSLTQIRQQLQQHMQTASSLEQGAGATEPEAPPVQPKAQGQVAQNMAAMDNRNRGISAQGAQA